eukprot:4678750-Pyramimonas_sp.AAC.1
MLADLRSLREAVHLLLPVHALLASFRHHAPDVILGGAILGLREVVDGLEDVQRRRLRKLGQAQQADHLAEALEVAEGLGARRAYIDCLGLLGEREHPGRLRHHEEDGPLCVGAFRNPIRPALWAQ